jgi:hypothetical protein
MFKLCVTEDLYNLFQHHLVAPVTLPFVADPRRPQRYGTHADIQPLQPASATGNVAGVHVRRYIWPLPADSQWI